MPDVVLDGVGRRFDAVKAVDRVELKVEHGEFVTLLGPSGCGKTTTLRMVAGLEQNDEGTIAIGGRTVSDPARRLFVPPERRRVGMVFQSYAIWPHMTVFDNVAYPLRVRRTPTAKVRESVMQALRLVELEPFAQRPAPALSGGQQQRVAIARAIVFEPEVLLLDEPLSNLDARLRAQTGGEFRKLQRRLGVTTLYVTHDQEEAMALSDRVVVMQHGRTLQIGSPETIYRTPATREVAAFFGSPNFLVARVAGTEPAGGGYRLSVEGAGWAGRCMAGEPFRVGDKVEVMVRPESVTLAASDAAVGEGQLAWRGRLLDCVFRGPRRSVVAEVDGTRFNVDVPAAQAVAPGDNVTLLASAADSWALPG